MNRTTLPRTIALIVTGFGFALQLLPMLAAGQEATFHEGERIRVTVRYPTAVPSHRRVQIIGTFASSSADSLSLVTETGRHMTFAQTNVTNVETILGHRGSAGTGALVGAGIGGLILGAAAAASDDPHCRGNELCFTRGERFVIGFVGGAGLGALLGLGVGSIVRVEKWSSKVLGSEIAARPILHARGGGLTIRF